MTPSGALAPGVAESWSASPDGLRYTFKLRDSKWSNGEPVVAGDFVYSFRRLLDPATGAQYANLFYVLKNGEAINKGAMKPESLGVKALDSHTLEIELERPTPYILGLLAHQTAAPVNPANVEKYGADFVRPGNLVSNGAYKLAQFTPNDRIVLTRNDNFHDAANVRVDREEILPLEDRSAALRRFQAGEIDSYNDAPADQIPFIRERLKDQFQISPTLGVLYLSFNTKKPPFDDPRVRNALSMVVDREFLAEKIWCGSMLPGYSLVPPGIDNYGPPVDPQFRDLSPIEAEDQAKALLKAAGYGPGRQAAQRRDPLQHQREQQGDRGRDRGHVEAARALPRPSSTPISRRTMRCCATAATTMSRARAGSAIIPIRRIFSCCSRATTSGSIIPAMPIRPMTRCSPRPRPSAISASARKFSPRPRRCCCAINRSCRCCSTARRT